MHGFSELVERCTEFTLQALRQARDAVTNEMQTSGATRHVKNLQMLQLQRAFFAVGMFSLFEAQLQAALGCANGFDEARGILGRAAEEKLKERMEDLLLTINVLNEVDPNFWTTR
jgi:hypothetical protein